MQWTEEPDGLQSICRKESQLKQLSTEHAYSLFDYAYFFYLCCFKEILLCLYISFIQWSSDLSFCLSKCVFSCWVTSDSDTPWTVASKAPLSMRFPRQEYWSGLPFLSTGDLSDPGKKPASTALAGRFFTSEPTQKPY